MFASCNITLRNRGRGKNREGKEEGKEEGKKTTRKKRMEGDGGKKMEMKKINIEKTIIEDQSFQ